MRSLIYSVLAVLCASAYCSAMYMPEDTEILEEYHLEDPNNDQISPEDVYFEVRSLTGHAMMPIRNKRSVKYEVLQSTGLNSHFVPKVSKDIANSRHSRSATNDPAQKSESPKTSGEEHQADQSEPLPVAEKQTMEVNRYASDQSLSGSNMMDRWTSAPFEYTKLQRHNDEDSMSDAAGINEGIKSRTPRVRFVTQPKKSAVDARDAINPDLNSAAATKSDIYRKIATERLEDRRYLPERNGESALGRYPNYDANSRRYDRYERDLLYQPPYMRSLDYMPRMPAPYPSMDGYYYDYFDRRYDLPDYRDNRNLYSNDLNERYPIAVDLKPPRNRRIIYYANLPEIVRTPPTVDLRYRTYGTRYDYPGYPPYNPFYRPVSTIGSPSFVPKSGAMKTDRNPSNGAPLMTDKRNDGSVRISSALTVKDGPTENSKGKILKRTHDYNRYY